jgi:hypothetical protein
MTYTLKLRCHGVIAYVVSSENNSVALFLPKARRRIVPDQVAYLKYPDGTLESSREPAPRPDGAPRKFRHLVLKRDHLSIDPNDIKDVKFSIDTDKDPDSSTPTSLDLFSTHWTPKLPELVNDEGFIDSKYFEDPLEADPRLIARLDINRGVMKTTGADPVQVPFAIAQANKEQLGKADRRPIARELLFEIELKSNTVTLLARKFKNNKTTALRFKTNANTNVIELCIGNESAADIYQPTLPLQPVDTLTAHCMAEFKLYYDMCNPASSAPKVPYLSSRPGSETCCSVSGLGPPKTAFAWNSFDHSVGDPTNEKAEVTTNDAKWSVFAYLAADNNLSEVADDDVDKLERPRAGVDVLVQVDRLERPTERLLLTADGFEPVDGKLENLNSGDARVLTQFLQSGHTHCKGSKIAVFLLSHGAGLFDFTFPGVKKKEKCFLLRWWATLRHWFAVILIFLRRILGVGPRAVFPDYGSADYLDTKELALALLNGRKESQPFEIIGFDACVMALVEMAYEIRTGGKILIASQDEVRAEGWPYKKILNRISKTEDPVEAARAIVNAFAEATVKEPFATLSAVRLTAVAEVAGALNELGAVLKKVLIEQPAEHQKLFRARDHARAFSNFHYIDLKGYCDGLHMHFEHNEGVRKAAQKVEQSLSKAIICTADQGCEARDDAGAIVKKQPGAFGLSIYLPNSSVTARIYADLEISKRMPHWYGFVIAYSKARSTPQPSAPAPATV